jgi:hypothetical protein
MSEKIEYRVREIKRYIVTRFEDLGTTGGVTQHGEYLNEETAHEVAYALCRAEHERLGWPIGDARIQYPAQAGQQSAEAPAVCISRVKG